MKLEPSPGQFLSSFHMREVGTREYGGVVPSITMLILGLTLDAARCREQAICIRVTITWAPEQFGRAVGFSQDGQ